MKAIFFVSYLCLCMSSANAQRDTVLTNLLQRMVKEDQWARHLLDTIHKYGYTEEKYKIVIDIMRATDHKHNAYLKQITGTLKSCPDYVLAGYDGAHDFWLLVQHQDDDTGFQKEALKMMQWAASQEQFSPKDCAYLEDRILLNTGRKQIYGTQFQLNNEKTRYIPRPLEDSAKVNERRAKIGLDPVETYIQYANERHRHTLKR